MKSLSPHASQQMDFCADLKELISIFDVCEKTIEASGVSDLLSVVDVLISTNEWFQRFYKIESDYAVGLDDFADSTPVRSPEVVFERLTELHLIHSHFDICASVVSDLRTDDLASLADVLINAASRLYWLQQEQSKLSIVMEAV